MLKSLLLHVLTCKPPSGLYLHAYFGMYIIKRNFMLMDYETNLSIFILLLIILYNKMTNNKRIAAGIIKKELNLTQLFVFFIKLLNSLQKKVK